ncbi:DUF5018 domain-containing protein [Sphingobacterium chuzhouense]|uniref:DUF5018 domain-containing protein n=1 Tax=Sphingobacterium chuzhouense TaxID=1742264 RepID=A0ABR7XME2_9SPHI|nr:DUF5018 domain-containing protein [Sphingobacterium chuzhouense]MBD1420340.1 DUF5018 domain-containing protein [Sphingobacterium chuzhouense]
MRLYIKTIAIALLICQFLSCSKEEVNYAESEKDPGAIYITFLDGKGFFNPKNSTPYKDTIFFEFPTHFPMDSENPLDITKLVLATRDPSRIEIVGQSTSIVDLSKEIPVIIHRGDGKSSKHIVKGVIKKSVEAELLSFSLPGMNIEGYIQGNKINLIAGGADLANLVPKILISNKASIFPTLDVPQDFNSPVVYEVTAQDGVTKKTYTVQFANPSKIPLGIRANSGRLLWTKTLGELGIDPVNHMTTSIAVSDQHLIVNTREQPNKIINRFNGTLIGQMTMGGITQENFQNFFLTADQKGQLLISNLVTARGNSLAIYKWKNSLDGNPIKIISWTMDEAWQVGRKMSIAGDLEGDALIYLAASNSGRTILRWTVRNGRIVSQEPEKIIFPGSTAWTLMADVAPLGNQADDPLIVTGQPGNISYWDFKNNTILTELPASRLGLENNNALDFAAFNNAHYVSFGKVGDRDGQFYLFDVTQPDNLSLVGEPLEQLLAFRTTDLVSNSNGNRTSDVVLNVSDDGYKLYMYCLLTNGSVTAYEFDCIDFNTL